MVDINGFKKWLVSNTNYSDAVISDVGSRMKRADRILEWYNDELYMFHLGKNNDFVQLSTSVKSQIRRSVKLYFEFQRSGKGEEIQ